MNLASHLRRAARILSASVLALGTTEAAQAAPPDPMATPPAGAANTVPETSSMPVQLTHFELTCTGMAPVSFKQMRVLGNDQHVVEYKAGFKAGDTNVVKAPGSFKFAALQFKDATSGDSSMFKWREMVVRGNLANAKRACEVGIFDANGVQRERYALRGAYPEAMKSPHLTGNVRAPQAGELTLSVEQVSKLK